VAAMSGRVGMACSAARVPMWTASRRASAVSPAGGLAGALGGVLGDVAGQSAVGDLAGLVGDGVVRWG
jgi:hypothetical protein